MDLRSVADQYSQEWKSAPDQLKKELLGDEMQFDEEGRNMVYNLRSREAIRDRLRSLHNSLTNIDFKEVWEYVENDLQQIAFRTEDLANDIQKIFETESENIDDVFVKSEEFEINMQNIRNQMNSLNKLIKEFYRGDDFPNARSAQLSFALTIAVAKFLEEYSGDTGEFLEKVVPLLIRFIGFMSLKFADAMQMAVNDTLDLKPQQQPETQSTKRKTQDVGAKQQPTTASDKVKQSVA